MTRKFLAWLVLVLMVFMAVAQAEVIGNGTSADEPAVIILGSVQDDALQQSINDFLSQDGNYPVRYYDVMTQQEIQHLAEGTDIDTLIMTETMQLQLVGTSENSVRAKILLGADYQPGQLVIVVLGVPQADSTYEWYPYRAEVQTQGQIEWDVPAADWQKLSEQPVSLHVLTGSPVADDGKGEPVYSKGSRDVIVINDWYASSGETIGNDFRVWIDPLTQTMQDEVARMSESIAAKGAILDCFPAECAEEAKQMLSDSARFDEMIAYDIVALRSEGYKESYGDVNVAITFSTSYSADKQMIVLAGFPIADAEEAPSFEWYVLNAEALGEQRGVEITLKQQTLMRMEQEPMMLVVISEPVD